MKIGLPSLVNLDPGVGNLEHIRTGREGEGTCLPPRTGSAARRRMIPSFVLVFCLARPWVKSTCDVAASLSWLLPPRATGLPCFRHLTCLVPTTSFLG
ncbi:hypothetical protein IMZ48_03310 [Candidatus Bathyarchaeota archaeon]|nr:hypothetical protein [Candidatus Bathyarchaeota archaeon]